MSHKNERLDYVSYSMLYNEMCSRRKCKGENQYVECISRFATALVTKHNNGTNYVSTVPSLGNHPTGESWIPLVSSRNGTVGNSQERMREQKQNR